MTFTINSLRLEKKPRGETLPLLNLPFLHFNLFSVTGCLTGCSLTLCTAYGTAASEPSPYSSSLSSDKLFWMELEDMKALARVSWTEKLREILFHGIKWKFKISISNKIQFSIRFFQILHESSLFGILMFASFSDLMSLSREEGAVITCFHYLNLDNSSIVPCSHSQPILPLCRSVSSFFH